MFEISKQFPFESSHQLQGLKPLASCPDEAHPCTRLHGHSYVATFVFKGRKLNDDGFLIDYHLLEPIKEFINGKLDHRNLNTVPEFADLHNPSAELMAQRLFTLFKDQFPALAEVQLSETQKTLAIYRSDPLN